MKVGDCAGVASSEEGGFDAADAKVDWDRWVEGFHVTRIDGVGF